jgi:hypothetical protein
VSCPQKTFGRANVLQILRLDGTNTLFFLFKNANTSASMSFSLSYDNEHPNIELRGTYRPQY